MERDHLILEFRLSNLAKALSPKTVRFYDDNLGIFFSHLQEDDPSKITPSDIRKFLASKRDRVSPHTLHCYYRTLRRFFNFLKEEGYMDGSPLDKVQPPKLPKLQPGFLNKDEITQFFGVINKKSRDYVFFLFLLDTGCRLSEVLNLTMDHLDLENRRAFIIGKGSKERFVCFGYRTARYLLKYLSHRLSEPPRNDFVFVSHHGRQLDGSNMYHICKRISRRVGLAGISPHTFRHTFATHFLADGGNELVLQRLLGHSSLEMVSRYAHITGDHLAKQHKLHSPADLLFG